MRTFLFLGFCLFVFIGGTDCQREPRHERSIEETVQEILGDSLRLVQQENEWLRLELKKYRRYAIAASNEIKRLDGENMKLKKKVRGTHETSRKSKTTSSQSY